MSPNPFSETDALQKIDTRAADGRQVPSQADAPNQFDYGSGWYHDEAIKEAQQAHQARR